MADPWKRKEVIGDCTLYLENRKRERARGHKKALKMYPEIGPCAECGSAKAERHHIDDNPLNNMPSNVKALCRRCHTIEQTAALNQGVNLTHAAQEAGRVLVRQAQLDFSWLSHRLAFHASVCVAEVKLIFSQLANVG
jgi:hypothetical protein